MKEIELKIFERFSDKWALVTAGNADNYNTMTIAWGSLGTLWGRPVATVYVSPDRYTHRFLADNDYFTVSFFSDEYRDDLMLLGSKSGRDLDKVAETSLTPEALEQGMTFKEAEMTLVCKKLYSHQFEKEALPKELAEGIYSRLTPHTMFIGEVTDVIK